jgi:hypothetical protein
VYNEVSGGGVVAAAQQFIPAGVCVSFTDPGVCFSLSTNCLYAD